MTASEKPGATASTVRIAWAEKGPRWFAHSLPSAKVCGTAVQNRYIVSPALPGGTCERSRADGISAHIGVSGGIAPCIAPSRARST